METTAYESLENRKIKGILLEICPYLSKELLNTALPDTSEVIVHRNQEDTEDGVFPYFKDTKNESSSDRELRKWLYALQKECFKLSNELQHQQRLRNSAKQEWNKIQINQLKEVLNEERTLNVLEEEIKGVVANNRATELISKQVTRAQEELLPKNSSCESSFSGSFFGRENRGHKMKLPQGVLEECCPNEDYLTDSSTYYVHIDDSSKTVSGMIHPLHHSIRCNDSTCTVAKEQQMPIAEEGSQNDCLSKRRGRTSLQYTDQDDIWGTVDSTEAVPPIESNTCATKNNKGRINKDDKKSAIKSVEDLAQTNIVGFQHHCAETEPDVLKAAKQSDNDTEVDMISLRNRITHSLHHLRENARSVLKLQRSHSN